MAVYGAYFIQDGHKEQLSEVSRWGTCWAYFNRPQSKWDENGGDVDLYILSRANKRIERFIAGKFFQTLTRGTVTISEWEPTSFNGKDLQKGFHENAVVIKCDPTKINANRFITAMRLITSTTRMELEGTPLALREYLPMLWIGKRASGYIYCDSMVTLFPTNFQSLLDYWEENHRGEGLDDFEDIYQHAWFKAVQKSAPTKASVSLEMLARIWNRTDEEMEALCPQKDHVFKAGYYKDAEVPYKISVNDEWDIDFHPDDIITISAPITDVSLTGETMVNTQSVGVELAALAKLIKNK